jgi:UDP-glucose 4-epimerase
MLTVIEKSHKPLTIANLGTDEYCCVDDSLGWICAELGINPRRVYTGGERGWIGDSPFIFLDTKFVRSLGWKPKLTIREAVVKTLHYLQGNNFVLQRRKIAA